MLIAEDPPLSSSFGAAHCSELVTAAGTGAEATLDLDGTLAQWSLGHNAILRFSFV